MNRRLRIVLALIASVYIICYFVLAKVERLSHLVEHKAFLVVVVGCFAYLVYVISTGGVSIGDDVEEAAGVVDHITDEVNKL